MYSFESYCRLSTNLEHNVTSHTMLLPERWPKPFLSITAPWYTTPPLNGKFTDTYTRLGMMSFESVVLRWTVSPTSLCDQPFYVGNWNYSINLNTYLYNCMQEVIIYFKIETHLWICSALSNLWPHGRSSRHYVRNRGYQMAALEYKFYLRVHKVSRRWNSYLQTAM